MEAAYSGIKLWALAVAAAGSDRPAEIRSAITRVRYEAPEGPLTIDAGTMHAERFARIGQVDKDLEFDVVWTSPKPIKPEPFPPSRSPDEWSRFMVELMQRFQDKQPPATPADEPR